MLCSIELVKVKGGTVKILQFPPAVHWPDTGVVSKGCYVQSLAWLCSTQTLYRSVCRRTDRQTDLSKFRFLML